MMFNTGFIRLPEHGENLLSIGTSVTFGVYIGFGGLIDGCSALGVVYEVSLEVVMTTRA